MSARSRTHAPAAPRPAWPQLQMGGDEALARLAMIARDSHVRSATRLRALCLILEQTGKLRSVAAAVDNLAGAIRELAAAIREHKR